jgi:hypothetical protein
MIEETEQCDAQNTGQYKIPIFRKYYNKIKLWLFLNIWCRHCYRHVMRLMHHFNLHYAPSSPLDSEYGERNHWCQWCGLRGTTWKYDPNKGLGDYK